MPTTSPDVQTLLSELSALTREADEIFTRAGFSIAARKSLNSSFGKLLSLPKIEESDPKIYSIKYLNSKTRDWPITKRNLYFENLEYLSQALSSESPNALHWISAICWPFAEKALATIAFSRGAEECTIDERRLAAVVWAYRTGAVASDFDLSIDPDCAPDVAGMNSADAIGSLLLGAGGILMGGNGFPAKGRRDRRRVKGEPSEPDPIRAGKTWRYRLARKTDNPDFISTLMRMLPQQRGRPPRN